MTKRRFLEDDVRDCCSRQGYDVGLRSRDNVPPLRGHQEETFQRPIGGWDGLNVQGAEATDKLPVDLEDLFATESLC